MGSPRCALRNIGVSVKAIDYVEIDEKAVRSYNAMFAHELPYKTQSVVGWNLKPDILIHGSPCQDFSIAGHQKGADVGSETRSSLMWETIEIIKNMGDWKPKWVIWENVKNVRSKHMVANHNRYLKEMNKMGYTSSFECLNAMEFGLPHDRNRIFTISYLGNIAFDFRDLIKTAPKHISEYLENDNDLSKKYIVTQQSILDKLDGAKSDSVFKGRIQIIDDHCKTITTRQDRCPNSGLIAMPDGKLRYLTEKECWRLQGYTDEDFMMAEEANPSGNGMNYTLYRQAGNSIPVPIFESIFRKILFGETQENEGNKQLSLL